MKRGEFWKKIKGRKVQCQLCPHYCSIKEDDVGKCKARQNIGWKLYALNYDQPVSMNVDPIEKKPLFHFLPGSLSFSIGMAGCNLRCEHCQNFSISQKGSEEFNMKKVKAADIVRLALENNCKSISYTYTEPLISYEYIIEIMKLAKKKGLKNVIVSNGFVNPRPLKKICTYTDGANIDLKAMSDEFYRNICGARLNPVLESLKTLRENNVWLEITNLLIPRLNDKPSQIKKLVDWVNINLGKDVPVHFTAFYPRYKMDNRPPTSIASLNQAYQIGRKKLRYVYTGNAREIEKESTYCPQCKSKLVLREEYMIKNKIKKGKCSCGEEIPGVWE